MSDDIKIKVGVRSSVKAGMDDVVNDIRKGGDQIESTAGMHGKGFSKAFVKGFKGDFSGSIETIMSKMGIEAETWKGKALVWGAGIGSALVAGWKAGKLVDEMFGISDKIAAGWNAAAVKAGKAWDDFYKKLRDIRVNGVGGEKDVENTVETDAKVFDIREKQKLKGMTGREKVAYYEDEVAMAEKAVEKNKLTKRDDKGVEVYVLSYKEQQERILALEEARARVEDARREAEKEEAAAAKKDYEDRIAKEKELADARKKQKEILDDFNRMQREQDAEALRDQIAGIHEAEAARREALEQRKKGLQAAVDMRGLGVGLIQQGLDPKAFQDARAQEKEQARAAARKARLQKTIEEMEGRGIRLSNRQMMAKEGFKIEKAADKAAADIAKLNQDALQAQKNAAASLKNIERELQDVLRMK